MADQPAAIALKARYVFPVAGPPIADGWVTIRGERIESVGSPPAGIPTRDLGNVAIVPGFVNAHTHLEFSDLVAPLGKPGMPLPDWIRLVIVHRHGAVARHREGVTRGFVESLRAGTTALGDIATFDWRRIAPPDAEAMGDAVAFYESIAAREDGIERALGAAVDFLGAELRLPSVRPALSPHAPYTVHARLLDALVQLARRHNVPIAMHLAESREELELLQTGGGPFRDMLVDLGIWEPGADARHASILAYLERLSLAPRALVIHGNYLSDDEIEFIAGRSATMSVVYCPRTHHYFRHLPYPLARMLESGVAVALGTDSRASNPDLGILGEMQFIAEHQPSLSGAAILELGTRAGARALGLDGEMGTLEPGKLANLAVVDLGHTQAADPHGTLFDPAARVEATYVRGRERIL